MLHPNKQDNLLSPWQPEAGFTSLLSFYIKADSEKRQMLADSAKHCFEQRMRAALETELYSELNSEQSNTKRSLRGSQH